MSDYRGRWALVTGASAGIGAEFARQLAAKGANLVLVARRADRLTALGDELAAAHDVKYVTRAADLSVRDAAAGVVEGLADEGAQPDILINNAGFGLPGFFNDNTWIEQRDFIELMVSSYAHFAHLLLPSMRAKNWGRIVNVASLAGLVPGSAGHTLYGPSKTFLVSFSQSLAAEAHGTGIKVSALCPGFTYSEFHDVNGTRELVSKMSENMFQQADEVVRTCFDDLEQDRTVIVPGANNKRIAWLVRHLPRGVAEDITRKQSARFRKRTEGAD
ncbi:MAG: SDR family oxidoreductase [Pseudomonadota bacterium]